MGKAYSEEEKEQIRVRLMEEGVRLFHENGSKTLSIRELTKRAGIAQGGFYSFYEDKDALIRDIISYRGMQKIKYFEQKLPESLASPMQFMISGCCGMVLDLLRKAKESQMYADMINLMLRDLEKDREGFHAGVMNEFFDYWRQSGYEVKADLTGIGNLLAAAFVLGMNGKCLDETYKEQEVEMLLEAGLRKYVEVSRT